MRGPLLHSRKNHPKTALRALLALTFTLLNSPVSQANNSNQKSQLLLLHNQTVQALKKENPTWRLTPTDQKKTLNGLTYNLLIITNLETKTTYHAWEDLRSDTHTGTLFDPNNPNETPLGSIEDGVFQVTSARPPNSKIISPTQVTGTLGTPFYLQLQTDPPSQHHRLFRPPPFAGTWKEKTSAPPGLQLHPQTGEITGTPTTTGTYQYLIVSQELVNRTLKNQTDSTLTIQILPPNETTPHEK